MLKLLSFSYSSDRSSMAWGIHLSWQQKFPSLWPSSMPCLHLPLVPGCSCNFSGLPAASFSVFFTLVLTHGTWEESHGGCNVQRHNCHLCATALTLRGFMPQVNYVAPWKSLHDLDKRCLSSSTLTCSGEMSVNYMRARKNSSEDCRR